MRLADKLPAVARIAFGTNIDQFGVKLTYRKLEDGLWMPDSYGGEMKMKALFFIKRKISFSTRNTDFRRADVKSTVDYATVSNEESRLPL